MEYNKINNITEGKKENRLEKEEQIERQRSSRPFH
jgi:hypothetical protein